MFEKRVQLAGRGSFILEYDDIGVECLQQLMRDLGRYRSSKTASRLSSIKWCYHEYDELNK